MQIKKMFQKKNFYRKKTNKNIEKNRSSFNKKNPLKHKKYFNQFNKVNRMALLKKKKPKITNYLHTNSTLKKGIFLKKPSFNEIVYPFSLNLKLINEYLKKK